MIVTYRNYTHDANENLLAISAETMFSELGIAYQVKNVFNIAGKVIGSSYANMLTKMNALKAAYAGQATGNLTFTTNSGTIVHQVLDANTIGGVRVVRPPSFSGDPKNYINWIEYSLTLEAIVPFTNVRYISFHESLSYEGGGSAIEHLVPVQGLPLKQITHENTPFRATQAGQIVGFLGYPPVPPPLWPAALKEPRRTKVLSPKRQGNALVEWPVEYEYLYESAVPLSAFPNRPPLG